MERIGVRPVGLLSRGTEQDAARGARSLAFPWRQGGGRRRGTRVGGYALRLSIDDGVSAFARALCDAIGEPRFQLWFDGKTKFSWREGHLVIGVPNLMYQDYLKKMYTAVLEQTARTLQGEPVALRWVIDPELFQKSRQKQELGKDPVPNVPAEPRPPATPPSHVPPPPQRARRWHRLEEFVVGPCNQVAYASARALLDGQGHEANPLVLHGPVGTGKTHLLEGIYAGLRQQHPTMRVLYLTAEDFTNRFLAAMHGGNLAGFRRQFRECDALLLDDLHFLARKAATQEEFLHTHDALVSAGALVVATCDCHPRLNERLMPELVDRLGGGAVFSLQPPEAQTRRRLLEMKCLAAGRPLLLPEVASLVADRLRGNVRELEGALSSLWHVSRATGRPLDLALARETLAEVLRHSVRVVQLEDVDKAVCQALTLEAGALQGKQRGWKVSHPRMLAMYLARKHTGATYAEIGQRFGGRNHSTAVAGEKKVRHWIEEDSTLQLGQRRLRVRDLVERIEQALAR